MTHVRGDRNRLQRKTCVKILSEIFRYGAP